MEWLLLWYLLSIEQSASSYFIRFLEVVWEYSGYHFTLDLLLLDALQDRDAFSSSKEHGLREGIHLEGRYKRFQEILHANTRILKFCFFLLGRICINLLIKGWTSTQSIHKNMPQWSMKFFPKMLLSKVHTRCGNERAYQLLRKSAVITLCFQYSNRRSIHFS